MFEHPKTLRRIYMVSSAAFGMASVAFEWMTPIASLLGLAVNLTEDKDKISIIEDLDDAVQKALAYTEKSVSSGSKKKIVKELAKMDVIPDSLSKLIKKTEAYQTQYCTNVDVREILNTFESYFRYEVVKRPHISDMYILSTGITTLEKLSMISEILVSDDKKLDEIKNDVSYIRKEISGVKKVYINCLNSIAFILVAMAVFLGSGIFFFHTYDREMLIIAPACYGISEFLIFYLNKEGYIYKSIREGIIDKYSLKVTEKMWKTAVTFVIPIILTVALFWIIYCAIDMMNESFLLTTISLVLGNIVSTLLKETKFEDKNMVH